MAELKLSNFKPSEFREFWSLMSPRLLVMLDVLRHVTGLAIEPSLNGSALGRMLGRSSQSTHNIDYWGEVLGVDCFVSHVHTRLDAENVVDLAKMLGFTGIGIYPGVQNNKGRPQVMFHFDVRPNRDMGDPALWGRVDGKYTTIEAALAAME